MDQVQKKYALNRIDSILSEKYRLATDKYTRPGTKLSAREKHSLVKNGKAKVRPFGETEGYDSFKEFDFSSFIKERRVDEKALTEVKERIAALAHSAKDEIMLGDSEVALSIIQKLQNIKI